MENFSYAISNPNPDLHHWRLELEEVIKHLITFKGGAFYMTHNQIAYQEYLEKRRSNRSTERETKRSNKAKEAETYRSNLAREQETNRANRANEGLTANRNQIAREQNAISRELGYANVNQKERAAVMQDATTRRGQSLNFMIQSEQHGEQTRSNLAREAETAKHNRATESETALHNRNVEREATRSAIKRENETLRSNLANEDLAKRKLATESILRLPSSLKDLGNYTKSIWRVK